MAHLPPFANINFVNLMDMRLSIEPPRTIMEVYKNLPEGTLAELVDNIIYMSPSPTAKHQKTLQTLFRRMSETIEDQNKAEMFLAPFDVYLDEQSNAVQPDIIMVLNENKKIIDPNGHIHGVPDLLVEILSPGNREFDLIRKKDLYEKFEVKEYWVVDPETRLAIVFHMVDKKYVKSSEEIGVVNSKLLSQKFIF